MRGRLNRVRVWPCVPDACGSRTRRQQQRFSLLRSLIEELVAAVDSNHIESRIFDDNATLEVGRKKNGYFSLATRWEIQPDYDVSFGAEKGESLFQEKPGFRVEETIAMTLRNTTL